MTRAARCISRQTVGAVLGKVCVAQQPYESAVECTAFNHRLVALTDAGPHSSRRPPGRAVVKFPAAPTSTMIFWLNITFNGLRGVTTWVVPLARMPRKQSAPALLSIFAFQLLGKARPPPSSIPALVRRTLPKSQSGIVNAFGPLVAVHTRN